MERNLTTASYIFDATAMAFIMLFCYAATSKISDFQNFQIQLAQSPMLSGFSTELSYGVPVSEFIIVVLFVIPNSRVAAMYLSFTLMVMFTAYIYIILNFSAYVPCSCGGVLEKLSWRQHLVFNLIFVCAAIAAILFHTDRKKNLAP